MSEDIPEYHEIHQVWRDNERLRTVTGAVEMAREGDRQAIETLMGSVVMKVENGRAPAPEVMEWVAECFLQILGRESADVAFGLLPGEGGARRPLDSKGRERRAEIAHYIISNSSPDERGSIKRATKDAASKFNTSISNARKIYDAYKLA